MKRGTLSVGEALLVRVAAAALCGDTKELAEFLVALLDHIRALEAKA